MSSYLFSAWDICHVKDQSEDWEPPHWVQPGITDTTRWYNELRVKVGDRLGKMDNDASLVTAHRHLYYYEEMCKGTWPHADERLKCYVLFVCSEKLKAV